MEPFWLPLGTESEPEDDFWKGSKNGRKKGIEALGKSGQERAAAVSKRGGGPYKYSGGGGKGGGGKGLDQDRGETMELVTLPR